MNRLTRLHLIAGAVWIAIFGAIYLYMDSKLRPTVAQSVTADGKTIEIRIPRSVDGHYYVQGAVNAHPVVFMVDTGASIVTISERVARAAGLAEGAPASFNTAAGTVAGRMIPKQEVMAGTLRIAGLRVAVMPEMSDHGLLGQNFLRHLEVIQTGGELVLRPRPQ